MRLVYENTEIEVKVGDQVTSFRGEKAIVKYFREPDHGSGKLTVEWIDKAGCTAEYYVSVFGLEWVEDPGTYAIIVDEYVLDADGNESTAKAYLGCTHPPINELVLDSEFVDESYRFTSERMAQKWMDSHPFLLDMCSFENPRVEKIN